MLRWTLLYFVMTVAFGVIACTPLVSVGRNEAMIAFGASAGLLVGSVAMALAGRKRRIP